LLRNARIIYSKRDDFGSRRPIDVIKANRPIIILDEPQKMGGVVTQKALKNFNPLFSLNYSATHAKQHNLVYVLDALDAYNKRLVKKIEVKGIEVRNLRGTDKYLYLESIVLSNKKPPMARIEIEVKYSGFIERQLKDVEKFKHLEKIKVPEGIDYMLLSGLSREIKEKLHKFKPINLGQASRISGVTPAAISMLMVYFKKING